VSDWQAIVLGLIQGLTEFLPISSSGHLVLAQALFGLKEPPVLYDIFLHQATLLAIVIVLRKPILRLALAVMRMPRFLRNLRSDAKAARAEDPDAWTLLLIAATTIVTGAIGVGFQDAFKKTFGSMPLVSLGFAVTGGLLWFTQNRVRRWEMERREARGIPAVTLKDAGIIGLAQAIAIVPSVSRSGATIAVALLLGLDRRFAGEFSFLVSIPAIAGAGLLELRHPTGGLQVAAPAAWAGFLVALVTGWISLRLLLRWIRSGRLGLFAYYCFAAAAASLWLSVL
jgi:undecaprenyl-diphosphatase